MTSYYVIAIIKLYLDVKNDQYIILCEFGGRTISNLKVIVGGALNSPRFLVAKNPGQNRVKIGSYSNDKQFTLILKRVIRSVNSYSSAQCVDSLPCPQRPTEGPVPAEGVEPFQFVQSKSSK